MIINDSRTPKGCPLLSYVMISARTWNLIVVACALPFAVQAQTKSLPLDSAKGLTLNNAVATALTFKGKKAVKLTIAPEAAARFAAAATPAARIDTLGIVDGVEFSN